MRHRGDDGGCGPAPRPHGGCNRRLIARTGPARGPAGRRPVPDRAARGGRREVGAQHQRAGAGRRGERGTPGRLGERRVDVHAPAHRGVGELHGMMDAVAGDQGVRAGAVHPHGDVARGVSGRRQEAQAGRDVDAAGGNVDGVRQPASSTGSTESRNGCRTWPSSTRGRTPPRRPRRSARRPDGLGRAVPRRDGPSPGPRVQPRRSAGRSGRHPGGPVLRLRRRAEGGPVLRLRRRAGRRRPRPPGRPAAGSRRPAPRRSSTAWSLPSCTASCSAPAGSTPPTSATWWPGCSTPPTAGRAPEPVRHSVRVVRFGTRPYRRYGECGDERPRDGREQTWAETR